MTDEPRSGDEASPTPPWERARTWNTESPEVTRVDELLARLGNPDVPTTRRRRRAAEEDDAGTVAASDLIAALAGPPAEAAPAAVEPAAVVSTADLPAAEEFDRPPAAPRATELVEVADTVVTEVAAPAAVTSPADDPSDEPMTEVLPRIEQEVRPEPDADSIRRSLTRAAQEQPPSAVAVLAPAVSTEPAPTHHDHRVRQRLLYAGRSAAALLSAVVLAAVGTYSYVLARADDTREANEVQALVTDDPNIVAPTLAPVVDPVTGPALFEPENILLIGSDTRAGANSDVGAGSTDDVESAQSDTMMIAHLSADRQRVQILSLPRDLQIEAPDNCHWWDFKSGDILDEVYDTAPGERWQINSAYSVGGPKCLVLAVQKFTGIRIDRAIGIDFAGFSAMVDALGGMTVNICRPIEDAQLGVVIQEAGVQTINGAQTLNLVRARKVIYDEGNSDPARIERQQKVLSTLLRQVTDAGTLLNPGRLNDFLQAFASNTSTDNVNMSDMVNLAGSLGDLSAGKVAFYSLPVVPAAEQYRFEPDPDKAPAIFNAIINDLPLPADEVQEPVVASSSESPSTVTTPPAAGPVDADITVEPDQVDVRIWNVTGRSGVAGQVQSDLNDLGFDITEDDLIRPDDLVQDEVTVLYASANRAAALTVLAAVPGAVAVIDESLTDGEIRLMVGADFDGTVSPVGVGDPITVASESIATAAAPTTPAAGQGTVSNTSLAPTDIATVNASDTSCI